PLGPQWTSPDLETSFGTGESSLDYEGGGVSLRIDHDLGGAALRSITAYRTFESRNKRDNDSSPTPFGQLDYYDEQWQFSQEFNLFGSLMDDRVRYTAGLYYFEEEADSLWAVNLAPGLFQAFESLPAPIFPLIPGTMCPNPNPMILCAGGAGNPLNIGFDIGGELIPEVDSTSYAAFLELQWDFTERLGAFAGGRVTYDEKDYSYFQSRFVSGVPTVPLTETDESWTNFSPRFGLTYRPDDTLMLYTTVASGYKAGGFNARPANPDVARLPFDPEELWSYEVGFKSDLAKNRLRLNGAVFFYDYQDMQLQANDLVGTQTVQVIDNVGESEFWGLELDLQWVVARGLTMYGSIAYLDAEYKETQQEITGVSLDTKLPKAPEWSATAAVEYRTTIAGGESLFRVDYSYTDESYADVRNTPQLLQENHSLVNARVAWTTPGENFTLALYGRNLTDEHFVLNGFDVSAATGLVLVIPNQPREVGVQGTFRF
ncbi:MAG: TonB-dependent receptor, partial [Haliea sp.]